MKEHADKTLGAVADAARAAGVAYDTVYVEHEHPYQAIIETAKSKGCDLVVMASHGRHGRGRPRQRDGQGTHAFQDPGTGASMSLVAIRQGASTASALVETSSGKAAN
jgi:nucleotide-binding universal stress UspA family protein